MANLQDPSMRAERLLQLLEQDPSNLPLTADAAHAAYDIGDLPQARALIERYASQDRLSPAMQNLRGLLALQEQRFEDAAGIFEALSQAAPADPALRFNLAWCKTMLGDYEAALDLLAPLEIAATPEVATLKVQTLHSLARLEEALALGKIWASTYLGHQPLAGALAAAAFDMNDFESAQTFAARAGRNHNGLATSGLMRLQSGEADLAGDLFEDALKTYPFDARALLGQGLIQLSRGNAAAAIAPIKRSAELFKVHLGSWLALGWACFAAGDYAGARKAFDKALTIDDTFAEIHGSLAVLDLLEGNADMAKRRTETALRLDRRCFSGALAGSLILDSEGKSEAAERIRTTAMNSAVGPSGLTLIQAMTVLKAGQSGGTKTRLQ